MQFWRDCLRQSQASSSCQQRQRHPPAPLQVHNNFDLFERWRQFLVRATTVVNHGERWTVGVPLAMAAGHLQADWEEIPTSVALHIANMQRMDSWEVRITRHKADEFHLGETIFYSQSCRSWRSEAQIVDGTGRVVLTAYWGMGLHRQSKYIYGLVLRISSRRALDAALTFLDNGEPLLLDFNLMIGPAPFFLRSWEMLCFELFMRHISSELLMHFVLVEQSRAIMPPCII